MKNDVVVLLLAGGKSNRFWPMSDKMEMTFMGKSVLETEINFFKSNGFSNIILVSNEETVSKYQHQVKKTIIQKGLGMGAAILSAKDEISDKSVLIIVGDDFVNASIFRSVLEKIESKKNFIIGYFSEKYFPGGYLKINGDKIEKIIEKPQPGTEPSKYVSIFGTFFTDGKSIIESLLKQNTDDYDRLYENAISDLIRQKHIFEIVKYQDTWITLKYPWHTLNLAQYFLSQIKKSNKPKISSISPSATLIGPIMLGENVKIMEYAKIIGPAYIGDNVIVGNQTLVRESMIESSCVLGYASDITRSYLGKNVWLHSNYIGDSVVSDGVSMGAKSMLANLRFDEKTIFSSVKNEKINTHKIKLGSMIGKNAKLGIGCCIMPGIKIGENCVIGAGTILSADLNNNMTCFAKQKHILKKIKNNSISQRHNFRSQIK